MTEPSRPSAASELSAVDLRKPNAARMYDYFLGGSHHLEVDRTAAEQVKAANPQVATLAAQNRAFLGRAVRYFLDHGIRQFLDLGSGIPTVGNVHELVLAAEPRGRVAYVDNERIAVAYSRNVLADVPTATITHADLRDVDAVLNAATVTEVLDLSQPVALLAVAVLHFVPDADDPAAVLARYRAALAPGSYLALTHGTRDHLPPDKLAAAQVTSEVYRNTGTPAWSRTREEIASWLQGLDLVEPGIVAEREWRADPDPTGPPGGCWAAVARL